MNLLLCRILHYLIKSNLINTRMLQDIHIKLKPNLNDSNVLESRNKVNNEGYDLLWKLEQEMELKDGKNEK